MAEMVPNFELRAAVTAERCHFVESLETNAIELSGPLDQNRQALMRLAVADGLMSVDQVVEMCIRRDKVLDLLTDLMKWYRGATRTLGVGQPKTSSIRKHTDYLSQNLHLWERAQLAGVKEGHIYLINEYGFGCFQVGRQLAVFDQTVVTEIADWSDASTQLLMFYGFNDRHYPGQFFLQRYPIELLAKVFVNLAQYGPAASMHLDWWDHEMVQELTSLSTAESTEAAIKSGCYEFLMGHEISHTFSYRGSTELRDLIEDHGYKISEAYNPDFPSSQDFGAWKRIKAGHPSLRDVTFLFGDLLANITLCLGGISPVGLTTLRAFNWWLMSPPGDGKRPRGNIAFMVYSAIEAPRSILPRFAEIVGSIRAAPHTTATLMHRFELECWQKLKQNYGLSDRFATKS